jgi:SPP1 gp7 family putative phage head morphogenesis protein
VWKVWLMKRRLAVSHHRLPRRVPESEEPFDYVDELEPVRQRDDSSWPSTPDAAREFVKSTVFPPLSKEHAQAMLDRPGPNNLTWEQRFRNYGKPDQDRIHRELSDGISSGENVVQIRKRMEGIVGGPRYRAQLIARTESTRVAGEATAAAGERTLGDMIEGKQMVVTMDQWTRPAHAALNGKMYYRTGPDVYVAKDGQPFPGDHHGPNCRCYGSIVLKPPEKFADDPALRAEFKTARAQDIPDPSSYSEWFMSASEPARRTAVGVRRYNAVLDVIADRRPEWTDFIDAEGGLLAPRTIQREKPRQRDERKAAVDALIGQRAMQFQHVYSQGFVTPTQNLAPADRTVIAGLQAEPPPLKRAAKRKRKP